MKKNNCYEGGFNKEEVLAMAVRNPEDFIKWIERRKEDKQLKAANEAIKDVRIIKSTKEEEKDRNTRTINLNSATINYLKEENDRLSSQNRDLEREIANLQNILQRVA